VWAFVSLFAPSQNGLPRFGISPALAAEAPWGSAAAHLGAGRSGRKMRIGAMNRVDAVHSATNTTTGNARRA
jgi:hypothetical protein